MKITCQSCQSKYNVADEKVQGKVVKIRCRKCNATIVVDGNSVTAAATIEAPGMEQSAAAPAVAASEGGAAWHVNLSENDQRTMSLPELLDAYQSSVVTPETFIWTDGMDDWRPLGEVEAVVSALHAHAQQAQAPAMPAPVQSAYEVPGPSPSSRPVRQERAPAAHAPSAASAEPMAAAAHAAAPARALSHGSGFPAARGDSAGTASPRADAKKAGVATRDGKGRGATAGAARGAAAAVSAADDDSRRTGERNENSVLFSLALLTQSAEEQRKVTDEPPADDSGLIDLKALAVKTESMRPAAHAVDEGVFTAPLGAIHAPLAMPAVMPTFAVDAPLGDMRPKSRLPLVVGISVVVLLLGVGGLLMAGKMAGDSGTAVAASATASVPIAAAPTPEPEPTATATASSLAAAPTASTPPSNAKGGGGRPGGRPAPRAGGGGGGGGQAAQGGGGGGEATPPPAKKGGGGDCGCNGDLMCLMKCSTH